MIGYQPPWVNYPSSFSTVSKLFMYHLAPSNYGGYPFAELEFPQLMDLVIDEANEVSVFLRRLLLPHILREANVRQSEEVAKSTSLPYPVLTLLVLKRTDPEDLDALRGVLMTLLESYQDLRLGYDAYETFPKGDEIFGGEMKKTYGKKVFVYS
ncbi:hypothetical protein DL93DRAFT_2081618 [Clavulina sp. PMI_390]|nr:hypothetical protein DL93DRAFT_2081618 [Clavulina sp. PMI_390]